jgi:hypothetical protein
MPLLIQHQHRPRKRPRRARSSPCLPPRLRLRSRSSRPCSSTSGFPRSASPLRRTRSSKGRPTKQITGDHAQFTNTQYVAKTQEELDHLLAACPYLYVEPLDGPLFEDKNYGFATRNLQAYQDWMNCEWRNAKEAAV